MDDNDYSSTGVQEDDGRKEDDMVAIYQELEDRQKASRGGYPFVVAQHGHALHRREKINERMMIYFYLLLATRLNMKTQRRHNDIDGTLLFERLAADIARTYFGDRASSYIFGSDNKSSFRKKIDLLCKEYINEGDGLSEQQREPTERDGKLDVVVWKHFSDRSSGKLIGFGQCKTGTHYREQLTQLQPDEFCRKWMRTQPVFTPIRMFFVTEALSRRQWRNISIDSGLLFDRCRVVDFADEIHPKVRKDIEQWIEGASSIL